MLGRIFQKKNEKVNFEVSDLDDEAQFMMKSYSDDFDKKNLSWFERFKEMFKMFWTERKDNERLRSENKELQQKAAEDKKRAIEEIQKREKENEDLRKSKNIKNAELNETIQKQSEMIQDLRKSVSELNERNRKIDEEKAAKEERRKKRKEYDRKPDKKVMARDRFETEEDYQMFMKRFKKMYYVDYVFCSFERYTLLRKEDNLKMNYKDIKQSCDKYKFDDDTTLKTLTLKTLEVVRLLFPKTLIRILDEYFMRVERENVFIDDSTCLFIEFERNKKQKQNLKKVIKRKKISAQFINRNLQKCLKTFHDEEKLLYIKRIGTHSFRHTGAWLLYKIGVPIENISSWLGHKSVKTTQIYLRIADRDIKESVKVLDNYQEKMFGNEVY